MAPLALDALTLVGAACTIFVLVLAVAVLWPRKGTQHALDHEIEARLMLGEDPDEIDRDLAQRPGNTSPVADSPLGDNPAG